MEEKEKTGRAKAYFRELLDIRGDMMGYEEIDAMMLENTAIHGSNMWILMLAIFIASIGLNVNSTAVIIGAMLISPLMSGILTLGYSLAVKDLALMRRSLASFGTQVAISLIASTLYFLLTPLQEPTAEMIARTSPTIWDVLIALFGGIAGMIGNTRQKKGNVIPGVAIATALMPPLCTAGYGIATLQPRFLLGAFYLFAINTLFIALSAALVTVLLRVPAHREISPRRQKKINRIIVSITVITVIPSILIGGMTVYNSVMDSNIERYLKSEFVFSDTQLVQSSTDKMEKKISVSLVGQPVSQEAIAMLQKELDEYKAADEKRKADEKAAAERAELMERMDAVLGDKQFIHDRMRDIVAEDFKAALSDKANRGKGDAEIFEAITRDQGYFKTQNPPAPNMPTPNPVNTFAGVTDRKSFLKLSGTDQARFKAEHAAEFYSIFPEFNKN